ncbi:STAS domain-containing protein [Streptomyces sp. NPDC048224]|uniref:STAS domain-containing protein n=1 Tax=Streptomyces sp. NPDC048224 TaxID=3154500 RepID=UPI0033C33C66
MDITTTIDGTSARISPLGAIDYDTLPSLRAAVAALPARVSDLLWDLAGTTFMDVAGLHLLFDPTPPGRQLRRTTVTGLGMQPTRLLTIAASLDPALNSSSLIIPVAPVPPDAPASLRRSES